MFAAAPPPAPRGKKRVQDAIDEATQSSIHLSCCSDFKLARGDTIIPADARSKAVTPPTKCALASSQSIAATEHLKIPPIEVPRGEAIQRVLAELKQLDDPERRKAELLHRYVTYKKAGVIFDQASKTQESVYYHQKATSAFLELDVLAAEVAGQKGKQRLADALQRLSMFQLNRSLLLQDLKGTKDDKMAPLTDKASVGFGPNDLGGRERGVRASSKRPPRPPASHRNKSKRLESPKSPPLTTATLPGPARNDAGNFQEKNVTVTSPSTAEDNLQENMIDEPSLFAPTGTLQDVFDQDIIDKGLRNAELASPPHHNCFEDRNNHARGIDFDLMSEDVGGHAVTPSCHPDTALAAVCAVSDDPVDLATYLFSNQNPPPSSPVFVETLMAEAWE